MLPRRRQRRVGECGCAAPGPRQQLPRAVAGRSPPPSCLRVFLPPDCSAHQTPRSTGCGSRSMLSCSRWLLRWAGADLGPASLAVELTAGSVSCFVKKRCDASRSGLAAGSHRLTTPQCYSYIDPDSHTRFLSPLCPVIPALVSLSRSVRPGGLTEGEPGRSHAAHANGCVCLCTTSSTAYFRPATTTTTTHYHYILLLFSLLRPAPAFSALSHASPSSLSLLNYGQQSAIL